MTLIPDEGRSPRCQRALELMRDMVTEPKTWGPLCHGTSTIYFPSIMKNGLQPRQCATDEGGTCRTSTWGEHLASKKDRVYLGVKGNDICEHASWRAAVDKCLPRTGCGEQLLLEIDPEALDKNRLTYDEDSKADGWNGYDRLIYERKESEESCDRYFRMNDKHKFGSREACIEADYELTVGRLWNPLALPGECVNDKCDIVRTESYGKMIEIANNCTKNELDRENRKLPEWVKSAMGAGSIAYEGTVPPTAINRIFIRPKRSSRRRTKKGWEEITADELMERVMEKHAESFESLSSS